MELPDKSRVCSELIVDSLRIKNNTINDFVNGPTLTYTGHYDVFRLIDIDAFTVTVTLPERYDKVDVKLVPLWGSIPDDPFVSIDSVTGPTILKNVRNVTVVSPTSITFTTIDGDHFWVTAYGRNSRGESDQWTCEVHPKIVPPNDHGVYSSALTSLMFSTLISTSTSYDDAVEMAVSHPGSLVISQTIENKAKVTVTLESSGSAQNLSYRYQDGVIVGTVEDSFIDLSKSPPQVSNSPHPSLGYGIPFVCGDRVVFVGNGAAPYPCSDLTRGIDVRTSAFGESKLYPVKVEGGLTGSGMVFAYGTNLYCVEEESGTTTYDVSKLPEWSSGMDPIMFSKTSLMLNQNGGGNVIGIAGHHVFLWLKGIYDNRDSVTVIHMDDLTYDALYESHYTSTFLTTDDAVYATLANADYSEKRIIRCNSDGTITEGDRIDPNAYPRGFIHNGEILIMLANSTTGQNTLYRLTNDLRLTPAPEIVGWESVPSAGYSIAVTPSRTVSGALVVIDVTDPSTTPSTNFMVADAKGDVKVISTPPPADSVTMTSTTTQRERNVTVPLPSPLSTSLRSRYGR